MKAVDLGFRVRFTIELTITKPPCSRQRHVTLMSRARSEAIKGEAASLTWYIKLHTCNNYQHNMVHMGEQLMPILKFICRESPAEVRIH